MGLLNEYSKEELEHIVSISSSFKDLARKLGYSHSPSGDTIKMIKKKIEDENISFSHFNQHQTIARNEENIFIENSTASQKTLRGWYEKGNYTPYICSICGQEPEWKGKPLTLILDHKNGINNDDRLENLRWVCPNCNQQLDTTGAKNPNRTKIAKKYYCIDCGKEISKGATRCISCEAKHRITPIENMIVSREELKQLIRTKPFTQIGKQFGVSDNAIRKWCEKMNLPKKSSDIKAITDEDWSKI